MPKINFNTPIMNLDGSPQMRAKTDPSKNKQGPQGQLVSDTVVDENGYVVMVPVMLKEILARVMNSVYGGEEKLPEGDRLIRGRLAHKIATSNTANYRASEVDLIREMLVKAQATPTLMAHADALMRGEEFTMQETYGGVEDDAGEAGEAAEPVHEDQKVA